MATLRRCAESLTHQERTLLAEAAATLPAGWAVDVVSWPEVSHPSLPLPSSRDPLPELEVRVLGANRFLVAAFGRPQPVAAAAAFMRDCAKNGGAT